MNVHDLIAKLAYKLWEEMGRPAYGYALENWFEAERLITFEYFASAAAQQVDLDEAEAELVVAKLAQRSPLVTKLKDKA